MRYVMKNGELFDADTLNTIWPVAKTLPKPFWWDTGPPNPAPAPTETPAAQAKRPGGPAGR